MIQHLEWDSHFFNAKIGKVEWHNNLILDELLKQKANEEYDRLYLFATNKIEHTIPSLLLVDEKVTYSKTVTNNKLDTKYCEVYNGPATYALIELALLSGHKSRFKTDPFFNSFFESFYTLWLKNSLNHTFADEVIVARIDNKIVGFVTINLKDQEGNIGLIAVDANKHGKGIGKDLLMATENWYQENHINLCNVVTQLDNKQACKFYEAFGYSQEKLEYIYHL